MKKLLLPFLLIAVTAYADPIGVINALKEPALRMEVGADSFHIPAAKEGISWGDSLKTNAGGLLGILFFEDGSLVKLSGNSAVELITPDSAGGKRGVNVKFGDIWAKIVRSDIGMEVKTPSAVASVKGTSFWVLVSPSGDTRLLCLEGLVQMINNLTGQQLFVPAGQMCLAGMDGSMNVIEVNPEEGIEPEGMPQQGEEPEEEGEPGTTAPTVTPPGGIEPSEGGGVGLGIDGAAGVSSLDGVNYQFISLRPDFSIWKFGIGLDLPFYFDSEGNLREEDWDDAGDVVDKIFYLRYGKPEDNFYIRGGALSPITFGYGLIMRRYTNAIEWPQVRRVGLQTSIKKGKFGFEGLINNFNELDTPGLVGGRLTFETKLVLPVIFGGTLVYDGNQYLGIDDEDGDGAPDNWDMFPGRDDYHHIAELQSLIPDSVIDQLIAWGDLPDINNPAPNFSDSTESVMEWGLDMGIPLMRRKNMNLWLYGQFAKVDGHGWGMGAPGARFNLGPLTAGIEYRQFEKEFLGEFFDLSYEAERVVYDDEFNAYVTKKAKLKSIQKTSKGYFADLGFNFFNLFEVYGALQSMSIDEGPDYQSVYGKGSLNTKFIPKVTLAEAYYNQPNAEDIFDTEADGTVMGYRVGIGLSGGVSLIMDNKTIYYNGEPNRITTIETAFTF